jgi:hypothetical protein
MLRTRPASDNRRDPEQALTHEIAHLYQDIRALLDEPVEDEGPRFRARLEHTLTDGYARALELEAESQRLERRVAELAGGLNGLSPAPAAEELGEAARRLGDVDAELTRLRRVLTTLRARASELPV